MKRILNAFLIVATTLFSIACTQVTIPEDSYGWFSPEELHRIIDEHPEGMLALRDLHSGTGQKAQINVFATTYLGTPYGFHHINAGIYDLSTGKQTDDVTITIGETQLVRRNETGPAVGEPQLNFEENPEAAKHYAQPYFGQQTPVRIVSESGAILVDTSLYFPELLSAEAQFQSENSLTAGDQIIWTPDPNCSHVLISVLAIPIVEETSSETIEGELLQKEIENTGSYTITTEDLSVIPFAGARNLQITLLQGGYYAISSSINEEVFTFGIFSEVWKMIEERP